MENRKKSVKKILGYILKNSTITALLIAAVVSVAHSAESANAGKIPTKADEKIEKESEFEKRRDYINSIINDSHFTSSTHIPLDAKKLWKDLCNLKNKHIKGPVLLSDLLYILDKDGFIALYDNKLNNEEERIDGYIRFDIKKNRLEINFGPRYGCGKVTYADEGADRIISEVSRIYSMLKVSPGTEVAESYFIDSVYNPRLDTVEYTGTLKTVIENKLTVLQYDFQNELITTGYNVFFHVLRQVLGRFHPAVNSVTNVKNETAINIYNSLIENKKAHEGAFKVWESKGEVLFELPKEKLGDIWCVQSIVTKGSQECLSAGDLMNVFPIAKPYKFEKKGKNILIKQANSKYQWSEHASIAKSIENGLGEPIVATLPIIAKNPFTKKYLVDGSTFVRKELYHEFAEDVFRWHGIRPSDSFHLMNIKNYSENTILNFSAQLDTNNIEFPFPPAPNRLGNCLESEKHIPLEISANLWWYKENNSYKPRLADERVLYFTRNVHNLDKYDKNNPQQMLIARWDVRKENPAEKVSKPTKQIVWTLDYSVPTEYREIIKEGILEWNKAFEPLGFKDVVRVQNAEDVKDYHPGDIRFNTVRWTMMHSNMSASTNVLMDPFTGEIKSSSIIMSPRYTRLGKWITNLFTCTNSGVNGAVNDKLIESLQKELISPENMNAFGLIENVVGSLVHLTKEKRKDLEDCIKRQFIKHLAVHEVGHGLGLRHNFTSHTAFTTDQLKDKNFTKQNGIVASVMDYTGDNIYAFQHGKEGVFYQDRLGEYDKWAIKYGYMPVVASTLETERKILQSMVCKDSGLLGLKFMTDEDTYNGNNPYADTSVLARDTLNYSRDYMKLIADVRENLLKHYVIGDKNFSKQTKKFLNSYGMTLPGLSSPCKFIGGVEKSRSRVGDEGFTYVAKPIDAKLQREALTLVLDYSLNIELPNLPKDVAFNMNLGYHNPAPMVCRTIETKDTPSLRHLIGLINRYMIWELFNFRKINDIIRNAEYCKGNSEVYSLEEYVSTICSHVFKEIQNKCNVSSVRRDTQFSLLNQLFQWWHPSHGLSSQAVDSDMRLLVDKYIKKLKSGLNSGVINAKLDSMSKLHYQSMLDKINRLEKTQNIALNH